MILVPVLMVLSLGLLPLGVMLLSFAFDQPDHDTCVRCRYEMRRLPTRCCPECGCMNPLLRDTRIRMRQPALFLLGVLCTVLGFAGAPTLFLILIVALSGTD